MLKIDKDILNFGEYVFRSQPESTFFRSQDFFSQSGLFFAVKIIFRSQDLISQSGLFFAVKIYFRSQKWTFFRSQFESEYKFW